MPDPIAKFAAWLDEAKGSEPSLPEAMALATADADGMPSVRMVLLKEATADGFVFYTNLGSRKARELEQRPAAALCVHWKSLRRQVRVDGPVEPVGDDRADAYFATRDRASQLGAWASRQSQPLPDRLALEKAFARQAARFGVGRVPRPPFWSGYAVVPQRIEFWQELPFRLHRRELFVRDDAGWTSQMLYP